MNRGVFALTVMVLTSAPSMAQTQSGQSRNQGENYRVEFELRRWRSDLVAELAAVANRRSRHRARPDGGPRARERADLRLSLPRSFGGSGQAPRLLDEGQVRGGEGGRLRSVRRRSLRSRGSASIDDARARGDSRGRGGRSAPGRVRLSRDCGGVRPLRRDADLRVVDGLFRTSRFNSTFHSSA